MPSVPSAQRRARRDAERSACGSQAERICRGAPLADAYFYRRVSSVEQKNDGLSLRRQLEDGRAKMAADGCVIRGEFTDVLSGRRDDRPDYQRLLLTVKGQQLSGRAQTVYVPSFDRLGRHTLERVRVYEELTSAGVRIVSLREGEAPALIYTILAAVAQEEVEQLQTRLREINERLEVDRWKVPGKPAWGYRLRARSDEERAQGAPKAVLEEDPITRPFVREAFERLLRGESMRAISIWAGGLPEVARGGRQLGYNAIRQLLMSPVYVGRHGRHDEQDSLACLARPLGRWPALVTDEEWERAAAVRALATRLPKQASGKYRLTGLIRCFRCGARMGGRTKPAGSSWNTKQGPRAEYLCNASKVLGSDLVPPGQKPCAGVVPAEQVERQVLTVIGEMVELASRHAGQGQLEAGWARIVALTRGTSRTSRIETLERSRRQAEQRLVDWGKQLADGVLTPTAYRRLQDDAEADLAKIAEEIGRLSAGVRRVERPLASGPLLQSLGVWTAGLWSSEPARCRDALAHLIEWVEVEKVRRGEYRATVHYTAVGLWVLNVAAEVATGAERVDLVTEYYAAKARWSTPTITVSA